MPKIPKEPMETYYVEGIIKASAVPLGDIELNFRNMYPRGKVKARSFEEAYVKMLEKYRRLYPDYMLYWKEGRMISVENTTRFLYKKFVASNNDNSEVERKYVR